MPESLLPAWIEPRLVPDQAFGQAYESLDDRSRGWLKACLARLYDRHAPVPGWRVLETGNPRAGYLTIAHAAPLDFALLLLPPGFASPSRLLAALLPALTAGVGEVLPVFLAPDQGEAPAPSPALLTALELAGQERACLLPPAELPRLLAHLERQGAAGLACAFPGAEGLLPGTGTLGGRLSQMRLAAVAEAGVWMEDAGDFDLAALRFAHPDLKVAVFGPCPRLPDKGFSRRKGDIHKFSAGAFDAVYLPEERMAEYTGRAPLALGPGQETCWAWPGLSSEAFASPRLGWFTWCAGEQA
jgi:hypothetical protein